MQFPTKIKLAVVLFVLLAVTALGISCSGSKANSRTEETKEAPKIVEVTTAAAINRELPQFFEATGSLAGDQLTDVAPQTSGKVVAVGVDIGSPVQRGQM